MNYFDYIILFFSTSALSKHTLINDPTTNHKCKLSQQTPEFVVILLSHLLAPSCTAKTTFPITWTEALFSLK